MKRFVLRVILFGATAGVVYLATLGCCQLMGRVKSRPLTLWQQLQLNPSQAAAVADLDKNFLAQKQASCERLCAKRAQIIQLLKDPEPDRAVLNILVDEVGQEQVVLEKATLDHLMAVRQRLEPAQRLRLMALMNEQLRTACELTACGMTPGCAVKRSFTWTNKSRLE